MHFHRIDKHLHNNPIHNNNLLCTYLVKIGEHNKFSIGVVVPHYVNAEAKVQQGATVRQIIEAFYHVWPGGQVFDANEDLVESNIPVGVSVSKYTESFKKVNHGGTGRSFSTLN